MFLNDEEAEDVHHFVEKHMQRIIGETALKLHAGRSRNEQIATDLRLFVRASCDEIAGLLLEMVSATALRAKQAGMAAMPSYTHLQRAEPVLVAHWLLAYCEMFLRDVDRLADCRKRVNFCPLGSGAIAGATLVLDREMVAGELSFTAPTANSMDATSDRDFAIEFAQVLSLLAIHLSRWAEEFILFSTLEYGFVHLPESYSTGSSAMPQKQNPDGLELIRGKAGRVIGAAQQLLITLKGLPLAYNKDMQETQEPVFVVAADGQHDAAGCCGIHARSAVRFRSYGEGRDLGLYECHGCCHLPCRQRRALPPSARNHRQGGASWHGAASWNCTRWQSPICAAISDAFGEDFYANVTLEAVLDCHDVTGGTARSRVAEALAAMEQSIEAFAELRGGRCTRVKQFCRMRKRFAN